MKDVTAAYIAKEEASQRKPVEIYKIWRMDESEYWYYTSGDVTVTFDSQDYIPATLKRDQSKYDSTLEVTTMDIQTVFSNDVAAGFLSINPVEIMWVQVSKLHREQSPLEADVVFIGQIKNVTFKGVQATVKCVGFETFLNKTIPPWRTQTTCNHQVFDEYCSLTESSYEITTTITLDSTLTVLTSSDFGLEDDGYWVGGKVAFGSEYRTVTSHSGNDITIMYKMIDLESSDSVDVSPGCDGRVETCRDKYDNILNFLGMPFTPEENPATRLQW